MIGRLTQEKINKAIEELTSIIADKYAIMMTPMSKLKDGTLKRYKVITSYNIAWTVLTCHA
jgi:hypothetical protein